MPYHSVSFPTQDSIHLRGRLYLPDHMRTAQSLPAIIMTQGFAALKEHDLPYFADYFSQAGFVVLIYDHRHFGESDGHPRQEVNPIKQASDYQSAWHFLSQQSFVDAQRIGLWGNSLSGGHVLAAALRNPKIACVVAQAPLIDGIANAQSAYNAKQRHQQQRLFAQEEQARLRGATPKTMAVAVKHCNRVKPGYSQVTRSIPAVFNSEAAWLFFSKQSHWRNQVTWLSLAKTLHYQPCQHLEHLRVPTLMITASHDTINSTSLQRQAFERIKASKQWHQLPGDHFDLSNNHLQTCCQLTCAWLHRLLL